MSVRYRDKDGNETLVAGMGRSGELVPSVSYYQTGVQTVPALGANARKDITVTLTTPMPDTDYIVYCVDISGGGGSRFVFSCVTDTQKTTTSFRVSVFNAGEASTVDYTFQWYAIKLMTDESRALDEAAIAANTTDITSLKEFTGIGGNNKRIDDSVDLNDIKEPGTYCWTSSVPTNAPSSVASTMIVQRISSDTVVQLVVEAKAGNIYKRGMYGTWQSWTQLKTSDSSKDIEFVDVASFADMRALPNNKFYQMRVSADITNDSATVTIPKNSRCIPVYKTSGDLQLMFYNAYPVTSATMFAVFLNSNGLNNVAKILG